jgi:transposase InsO family protein
MPFGLTNAPATFQAYISRALRGLVDVFCIVYLDDILIFSKNPEEHQEHLELVIERLRRADLYANPLKCEFFKPELEYLGFLVNKDGMRMDPARVETISKWPRPKTYRDIQVFLGFCNFYRRFIFNFSGIARPLHQLLHGLKNGRKPGSITDQEWQQPQKRAFEQLIAAFVSAPVLRHYDPTLPMRVEADASSTACAGILSLLWEDGWHPIAYCSKKFSGAEVHYPIYDKELYAIVYSFKQWRHYLEGAPGIEVWSDHENLKQFMTQATLNGRQARWLIQLAPYDFTIHYRKGKLNPADGPSRRPDYVDEEGPDTVVSRLMPTLANKLATASRGADEQVSDVGADPLTVDLIRALSLQAVTRSEARRAARALPGSQEAEPAAGSRVGLTSPDPQDVPEATGERPIGPAPHVEEDNALPSPVISGEDALSLKKLLKDAQELDPLCRRLASQLRDRAQYDASLALLAGPRPQQYSVDEDGLLRCEERVLVPAQEALRHQLLETYHDCGSAGHWGRDKTLDLLRRRYTWSGITDDVREYVATCPVCQGKAVHRHKPYGQLQPLPIPTDLWNSPFKEISLDWITGLPVSRRNGEEYDSILTIVCRVTKYALFIPTREDSTAVDFAELFFEHVECRFGTPRSVVTDRDSRITSEFWREVCEAKIIKRRMSTAYHPQTDGQSEALNRIVEDYLRAYSAEDQTAWAKLLPLAQFSYNNSRNSTTGMSPNRLLFGFDCEIRVDIADNVPEGRIPAAKDRVEKLHQLRQRLRTRLMEAQERMARYYNANHVPKQFRVGDFVKLSTKHLKFKNRKLSPRWVGPFRVLERIGGQAYRIALPHKYARLHDVFPVQLLEDYRRRDDDDSLMQMPDLEDPQDEWEVEEIRDKRKIRDTMHYLVKWAGWPSEYNSYEPAFHLANAPDAIAAFERKLKRKRKDNDDDGPAKRARRT